MTCLTAGSISRRRMVLGLGLSVGMVPLAGRAGAGGLLVLRDAAGAEITLGEDDFGDLPWQELSTHTAWTDGLQRFAGPYLRDVLLLTGRTPAELASRRLRMRALNDFEIEMPARDAWEHGPILARVMNGARMQVRDKGPLWLVYPRDGYPELQDMRFDERWIWQLCEIDIR